MIKIFKIDKQIYCLPIKNRDLRCRLFLRYQEYYESPKFKDKTFTIKQYINWYKKQKGLHYFSYSNDWEGFNLTSQSIEQCFDKINDHNVYDSIFYLIFNLIKKQEKDHFYIIGSDNLNSVVFKHELSHSLFSLNASYQKDMLNLIQKMDAKKQTNMRNWLINKGYHESVILDEIQAYMATGVGQKNKKDKEFKKIFDFWFKLKKPELIASISLKNF